MPEATFTIKGEIIDFLRVDNLYKTLKRESEKLLDPWQMDVSVIYTEKKGEKPE